MLRCYLLTLAGGSSVDQVSNNFSLFNLVEQVNIGEETLGREVGIEAHIYWLVAEQAKDREFEIRVLRVSLDDGSEDAGAAMRLRPLAVDRMRFRTGGFRIPKAYGRYLLAVEWRAKGSDAWQRETATWPLVVAPEQPMSAQSVVPPSSPIES